jgi:hypothetical protein
VKEATGISSQIFFSSIANILSKKIEAHIATGVIGRGTVN